MGDFKLPEPDLSLPSYDNFSPDQLQLNSSLFNDNLNFSGQFPPSDFYNNFADSHIFSAKNLTALEDFEEFDWQDLMNVVAYTIMSAGRAPELGNLQIHEKRITIITLRIQLITF